MRIQSGKASISLSSPTPALDCLPVSQPGRTRSDRTRQILLKQWQVIHYHKLRRQAWARECRQYQGQHPALTQMRKDRQRRRQRLEGWLQTAERNRSLNNQVQALQNELRTIRKALPGKKDGVKNQGCLYRAALVTITQSNTPQVSANPWDLKSE